MSSVVFVLKLLGKSSHLKIISTARREREDASHLLVDEHVGFGAFDVSVRDPLHVVVRAKKPSAEAKTKTDYELQVSCLSRKRP